MVGESELAEDILGLEILGSILEVWAEGKVLALDISDHWNPGNKLVD